MLYSLSLILFAIFAFLIYKVSVLTKENNSLIIDKEVLKSKIELFEKSKEDEDKLLNEQKEVFENLSNKALEEQNKKGSEKIDEILKPFKENIEKYQDAVNKINGETKVAIETKINDIIKYTQEYGEKADRLAKAFEGDKKAQGNFGEMILKNLLESFSFEEGIDYYEQQVFRNDEEKKNIPDFIFQIKPNEWLAIDSKFSLSNYEKYINEENKIEKQKFLKNYVDDLKNRIKDLGSKKYYEVLKKNGKETPDFVCLFFANEMAYLTAISDSKNRIEIIQLAKENKVAIITSSSFIPVLQMAKYIYKIEESSKNIRDAVFLMDNFFKKISDFFKNLTIIHNNIKKISESYKKAKECFYDDEKENITQIVCAIKKKVGIKEEDIKFKEMLSKFDDREKEYINNYNNEDEKNNCDNKDCEELKKIT